MRILHTNRTTSITPVSVILTGTPHSGQHTLLQRLVEGADCVASLSEEQAADTPFSGQSTSVNAYKLSPAIAVVQHTHWSKHDYSGQRLFVSHFLNMVSDKTFHQERRDQTITEDDYRFINVLSPNTEAEQIMPELDFVQAHTEFNTVQSSNCNEQPFIPLSADVAF